MALLLPIRGQPSADRRQRPGLPAARHRPRRGPGHRREPAARAPSSLASKTAQRKATSAIPSAETPNGTRPAGPGRRCPYGALWFAAPAGTVRGATDMARAVGRPRNRRMRIGQPSGQSIPVLSACPIASNMPSPSRADNMPGWSRGPQSIKYRPASSVPHRSEVRSTGDHRQRPLRQRFRVHSHACYAALRMCGAAGYRRSMTVVAVAEAPMCCRRGH